MTNLTKKPGKTKDEIAQAYVAEPWWYDVRGFFILTFAYNSTLTSQLKFFGVNFGTNHLEAACGTGTLLDLILRWRRWKKLPQTRIVAFDYSEAMLAGAMHRFARTPNMELIYADAADLPLQADQFDTANIANSVHCFPDIGGALKDIARVLIPGGTLAMNVLINPRGIWPLRNIAQRINRWGIKKGILYATYEPAQIDSIVNLAGFDVERRDVQGNCYNVLARKRR